MKYLLLICFLLVGCNEEALERADKENRAYYAWRLEEEKAVSKNCTDAGGLVIRSAWDSKIIECKVIKEE